ncbi:MAG: copper amine oxidase N-terminal domain-containing protein [Clostridiales bacterium]|nr:copper amine oxidase N-terminal domain-containing protein [Clostridiales bacterium]
MKKKLFVLLLTASMIIAAAGPASAMDTLVAKPTSSTVLVNGSIVSFDAYNISGNNYFKLRDVAHTLSGTEKQYEVAWDAAKNAISLTSDKPYTAVGGEMTGKGAGDKTPAPTSSKIYLDGKEVSFTAYNIEGNNYFKLRDIGAAFDFGVDWDGANNTIVIDTSKGYTPETPPSSLTGKYTLVSWEIDGEDWLTFFETLGEMANDGSEFNREDIFIEFLGGGVFMGAMEANDDPMKGTFTVDGNTVTLNADGDAIKGTVDGNKIIIEMEEEGTSMKMVFENKTNGLT